MASRSKSGPGTCVLCDKEYSDLLDHINKRHQHHTFHQQDVVGAGLLVCHCGRVVRNQQGLNQHQLRFGCMSSNQQSRILSPASRARSASSMLSSTLSSAPSSKRRRQTPLSQTSTLSSITQPRSLSMQTISSRLSTLPSAYRSSVHPGSPLSDLISHGLHQLDFIRSSPSSSCDPSPSSSRTQSPVNVASRQTPPTSLDSDEEEEEPLEYLDNIQDYQEMVEIVASTRSSSERPLDNNDGYQDDGTRSEGDREPLVDDDEYRDDGSSDNGDTQDQESEQEAFEDILDYEAEMEQSEPSLPSQCESSLGMLLGQLIDSQHLLPAAPLPPILSMTYGTNHLLDNASHWATSPISPGVT